MLLHVVLCVVIFAIVVVAAWMFEDEYERSGGTISGAASLPPNPR